MRGKKLLRGGLYTPSKNAEDIAEAIDKAWEKLKVSEDFEDQDTHYWLTRHIDKTIPLLKNFGEKSAIELMGKLGIWMVENDIVSIGEIVKADDNGRGSRSNIYR